ncbi:receptor-type tyrosine-protein phosphatase epsilon-like isoform X1 [Haliotis rufescens]|uniref:receptor-type tyrosine-protein phosphatase epsilon-like isoform X1 n=1 Tax=Haliotis rufescens TaxID=6454 RepID=UPI00201F887F|nr:receptor-type tyrosine-protein phosphatase epsilon-like isoform X1 [Haliotis rufescens]
MFRRKNVWYFLWIFPVVVIVCNQQLPPHTVNVALNKPATQPGNLDDTQWCHKETGAVCGVKKANLSVDGNIDTQYWKGSCSHVAIQDNPWWQVDLGQVYNISWIKIYNRARSEDRVNSMKVTVGNTTCYTHNSSINATTTMDIRCDNVTQGRLLNVSLTSGQKLSLCEVQVLVCDDHWFGPNCSNQCHCMNNATCDKTTGYCGKGCGDGWTGNDCQTECNNFTFGVNCSKNCHCDQNTTCAKITGYCKTGCAAGWIGTGCQTACQNNTFGLNCTHQCHCMNNTRCEKTTGCCQNGCAAGWTGNVCQTECNNYTFGVNCSENCHCDQNSTCAKTTGYCKNGCAAGWIGNSCQTACQNNTFGLNCTHQCHCMNNTKCDKTTGYCQNRCSAGWTGNVCQTECNTYTFGVNCSQNCHCDKNTTCDKTTGFCENGCAAGWTGCGCQTQCNNYTFGVNCSQKCHCDKNTICDKATGYCQSGCAAGWTGGDCHTECSNYKYGDNCSQTCHCKDNTTCNKTTGYCQGGCAAGWVGDGCQTVCSNSTYGINCINQCHCKSSGVCEKTTGHCESGCADGWTGESCQKPETGLNPAVIGGGVGGAVAILVVIAGIIIYKKRDLSSENNTSETKDEGGLNMPEIEMRKQSQPAAAPHVDDPGAVYANIRSRAVRVSELQQYIHERYGIDKGFENEYNMFPPGKQHPCDIGNSSGNKGKNRFIGIYPYDHSRVLLKKLPGKDHSDYINANYVHGYNTENAYIATQGPNPVTLPDFWRMIWEHDIKQIVMLTNVYETAKKKCEEYWPEAGKRKPFENILVVNNGETARADWVIRNMELKHKKTGEKKTVSQYHFVTWPDHGVPSAPAIVTFWKKVCHDGRSEESPLVVHCSAGIGRTGTFIGLDFLFDQAKAEGRVDFYHCIQKMRENRVNMIQTAEQYRFLHEAVFEATQSDSTFYTEDTFERAFQTSHFADEEENELIFKEMNSLNALRRTPGEKETKAASFSENRTKNRSRAVIPADRHRVMLSSPAPGTNDYINAVSLPFFAHKGEFLVTQMPLKKTVVDFWRMVVERGCNLIVTLDAPDSVSSDEDVGVYLPRSNEPITCSPFIVLHNGVNTPCEGVTETFLTVKREGLYANEDITSVSLLTFNDWPKDQEVPPHTKTVIRFLNNLDQRMMNLASKPVVVHCFDGATRSGLICCLMNIMSRLKLDKEIDIHLSVRELKQRRRQFIPSSVQLRFCFAIVKDYLNANRVSRHL